jgi:predicted transcriptional regulator
MPANARSQVLHDVLQQRLQVLQTEQQADLTRAQTLEAQRQQLVEACLRRAGAIAELEALCQPIVATKVEEDGRG